MAVVIMIIGIINNVELAVEQVDTSLNVGVAKVMEQLNAIVVMAMEDGIARNVTVQENVLIVMVMAALHAKPVMVPEHVVNVREKEKFGAQPVMEKVNALTAKE